MVLYAQPLFVIQCEVIRTGEGLQRIFPVVREAECSKVEPPSCESDVAKRSGR